MLKEAKEPILHGGMLEFLKTYNEKREKAEEEKLGILKEMNDQKTAFFDRFFQFMEKSKNN